MNAAAADLFGFSEQAAAGHKLADVVGPTVMDALAEILSASGDAAGDTVTVFCGDQGPARQFEATVLPAGPLLALAFSNVAHPARQISDEKLRDFAEASGDWFWECDEAMRITYMSARFYEATGLNPEDVIGRTRGELGFSAADEEAAKERSAREAAREPIWEHLSWAELPDGRRLHTRVSGKPVFDAAGEFRGYRGATSEITSLNELQNALQQSRSRFQDFAEASSDWFWETDAELRFHNVSDDVKDHVNLTPGDLYNVALSELQPAYDQHQDWDQHLAILANREPFREFVFVVPDADGGNIWCAISGMPYRALDGTFLGYRGVGSNISKRVRAEKVNHQLAKIVESTDAAIASSDREGRILSWNAAAERIFGVGAEDAVGQHHSMLTLFDAEMIEQERLVAAALSGDTIKLDRLRVTRSDGREVWIALTLSPVEDQQGYIEGTAMVARETTELVRSEQQRQRDQEQLRVITDAVPAVIGRVDRNLVNTFSNQTGLQWHACSRDEIVGQRIKDFFPAEELADIEPYIRRALAGETVSFTTTRAYPDGVTRGVAITYHPDLAPDGEVRGFYVLVIDQSEQLAADAALREKQAQLDLVANAVPVALGHLDHNLVFRFVNETALQWYGNAEHRLLGEHYGDVFPPEIAARVLPFAERALAGESIEFETHRTFEDGRERTVAIVMTPDIRDDGSTAGVFLLASDITQLKLAEARAQATAQQMQLITDAVPALIAYCDRDYRYLFANKTASRYYDRPLDEIIGKRAEELIGEEAVQKLIPYADRAFSGEEVSFEGSRSFADGRFRHFQTTYVPDCDDSGHVKGIFLLLVDITTRKAAEKAVDRLAQQFKLIIDAVPAQICYCDSHDRYLAVNRTFGEWLNVSPESMIGKTPTDMLGPSAYATMRPYIDMVLTGEKVSYEIEREYPNGQRKIIEVTLVPDVRPGGEIGGYFVLGVDISDRKKAENELRVLATTDSLTGVSNRRRYLEVAAEEITRSRRYRRPLSVVMCDIDHFKAVNDTFGHDAGDKVLVAFADIAMDCVRGQIDRVGRLGGEEFALLLPETDLEGARDVAERLRQVTEALTVDYEDKTLTITCSLGVARLLDGESTIETTLARADGALYEAKTSGRNRVVVAEHPSLQLPATLSSNSSAA